MRLDMKLEHEDGTVEFVAATVPDLMAWERKFGTKTSDLATGAAVTDLAFLAWNALKRTGQTTKTFEVWSSTLVDLERTESEARPTQPEA